MPKHTIRVSQRVFYEVEIEAETAVAALGIVDRWLHDGSPDAPDLSNELTEVDSDNFVLAEDGQVIEGDPEFDAALARLAKGERLWPSSTSAARPPTSFRSAGSSCAPAICASHPGVGDRGCACGSNGSRAEP